LAEDPYSDPITGILRNKLGLGEVSTLHPFREGNGRTYRKSVGVVCRTAR
jgi:hypothetical protein